MPERYRDLALLKAHMLAPQDRADALVMLDRLARPGAPYRALAVEQQAYMMIEDGDVEGGTALLQELLSEQVPRRLARQGAAVDCGFAIGCRAER